MVHKGTLKNSDCTERNLFCSCLNWKRHQRWWYWKELCTETNLVLKGTLFWKEPCTEMNFDLKGTLYTVQCTVYWKELCSERNHLYINMMRDNLQNVNCPKKQFLCVKPYLVRSNQNRCFKMVGRLYELQTFCVLKIYVLSWIGIDKLNHHLEISFFFINWTHLLILSL